MSPNTYQGLHAEHYDLVYADKPYVEEARFVHEQLSAEGQAGGRLLDVACGTGRHALALDALGWQVAGVDVNPELVERARAQAAEHGVAGEFDVGDMRDLQLPGERFSAVTCLFDAIGYALTNEGVLAALSSIRRHMADDGLAAIEFLHAPAMLRGARRLGVRTWDLPDGGELVRIARTRLNEPAGTMRVAYDLIALESGGTYRRTAEEQENRYFGVEEMRALLTAAALVPRRFVAAYAEDPAVEADTFHVLAVAGR